MSATELRGLIVAKFGTIPPAAFSTLEANSFLFSLPATVFDGARTIPPLGLESKPKCLCTSLPVLNIRSLLFTATACLLPSISIFSTIVSSKGTFVPYEFVANIDS